ncbi:MAG: glycosyltransferase family 4 protein [Aerococcus sanguinicola]
MKKALMYASVASMIDMFNMNNIKILKDLGYQVDVACNFEDRSTTTDAKIEAFKKKLHDLDVSYYHLPIPRQISKIGDIIKSYQLSKKLAEKDYDVVHCHSPIGAALCRLAFRHSKTKIIYTAHGFHFYEGAPLKNWLIFYPVEKILARYTDILITINQEDYERAETFNVRDKVVKVNGVGIDTSKFKERNYAEKNSQLLNDLNLDEDDVILTSVGQLSKRKNHRVVIEALAKLKNRKIKYLIVGEGELRNELTHLIKENNLEDKVILLGFRSDIDQILGITDIFVLPSLQEGLPVSLMEAMGTGLPCIVSDIRGNRDLIDNKLGGYLCNNEINKYQKMIRLLCMSKDKRFLFGKYNAKKIKKFDKNVINLEMIKIYN